MTYEEMRDHLKKQGIIAPDKPGSRSRRLRCGHLPICGTYANAEGDKIDGEGYLTCVPSSNRKDCKNCAYWQRAKSRTDLWEIVENYNTRKDGTGEKKSTLRCHLVPRIGKESEALTDFATHCCK